MEAIVLAGGYGSRLKSVVADVPKPMAPVAGKPFLEHVLAYWTDQGIDRFILSTGYMHEVIEDHFGDQFRSAGLTYARETEPLGTGGGLLHAAQQLRQDTPFLVLNGDTFFELSVLDFRHFHSEKRADVSIALLRVAKNTRYGSVTTEPNGKITSFLMAPSEAERPLINGGIYLFNRDALTDCGFDGHKNISLESKIFPGMLRQEKQLYGFVSESRFIDIGLPEDYRAAEDIFFA